MGRGERCGVRVVDFSRVTSFDIEDGRNVLTTPFGEVTIGTGCGYAVLEPLGDTQAWATLEDECVGVRRADGDLRRFNAVRAKILLKIPRNAKDTTVKRRLKKPKKQ